MTREEAIAVLEESKRQNEVMRDNPSTFWASNQMVDGIKNSKRRIAALDLALSALRPVSREQVEKVWKGEWKPTEYPFMNECEDCSVCGYRTVWGHGFDFCPGCGAAQTDKAVEMVMERMEALKDGIYR